MVSNIKDRIIKFSKKQFSAFVQMCEKTDKKPENNQMREGADKNKKQMERMLEALKNSEKQTLNKVKRKEEDNAQKRSIEKDW